MEFVRDLLLQIEAAPAHSPWGVDINRHKADQAEMFRHLELLVDAGFITVQRHGRFDDGGERVHSVYLTWFGHEFLDTIRSDRVWEETKHRVKSTVGTVAVSVVSEVAKSIAKGLLGLP